MTWNTRPLLRSYFESRYHAPRASLSRAEVYMQAYTTNTTYPAQETQRLFNTWSFNNCRGRNLCVLTKTQLSINTSTIRKTTFPILQVVEQVHQQNCSLTNVLNNLKICTLISNPFQYRGFYMYHPLKYPAFSHTAYWRYVFQTILNLNSDYFLLKDLSL